MEKNLYILSSADGQNMMISDELEAATARFEWHVKSDPGQEYILGRYFKVGLEYKFLSVMKINKGDE